MNKKILMTPTKTEQMRTKQNQTAQLVPLLTYYHFTLLTHPPHLTTVENYEPATPPFFVIL